jgi:hypothetical protein
MILTKRIKAGIRRLLPRTCDQIDSRIRQRQYARRNAMAHAYIKQYGMAVQHGPFAGMHLIPEMIDRGALPLLVGSFEEELHGALLARQQYRTIINIGASFGYYSVGLALLNPAAHVHAFESDAPTGMLCSQLAKVNNVYERLTVHGLCTAESLVALPIVDPCLIVCDCEGAEYDILKPDNVPLLARASVIVELHARPNVDIEAFLAGFATTHNIIRYHHTARDAARYRTLSLFSRRYHQLALTEFRWRGLQWAHLTPR